MNRKLYRQDTGKNRSTNCARNWLKNFKKIIVLCFSWLGLSGLLAVPAAADFARALYDYGAENYTAAYDEFTRLASLGHKDSQFNLGAMYFRGQGVKRNSIEAYAWISLAAESDDETRIALRDQLFSRLNETEQAAARERAETLRQLFGEQALSAKLTPVYVSNEESEYALTALESPQPAYPVGAKKISLSGSVDVEFSIDANGHVRHYVAIDSTNKIFEKPAIDALKNWRYQPFIRAKQPIELIGVRKRIFFRMENDLLIEGETLEQYIRNLRYKAQSEVAVDMHAYAYNTEVIPEAGIEWQESNRWYFNAAQGGVPEAQYQLGRNLFYGKGCIMDRSKSIEWLTRAARAKHAAAQYLLATILLDEAHPSVEPAQVHDWLEQAVQAQYPPAMIKKSWMLATGNDEAQRNGARALELARRVADDYPDKFSVYRARAASHAELGDFNTALRMQKRVIKLAQSLKMPVEIEQQRLAAYNQKIAWRE